MALLENCLLAHMEQQIYGRYSGRCPMLKSFFHGLQLILTMVTGGLEPVLSTIAQRQGTPWTGCQYDAGLTQRHIRTNGQFRMTSSPNLMTLDCTV